MSTPPLSDALFRESSPGFFRVLAGRSVGLYLDALDRLGHADRLLGRQGRMSTAIAGIGAGLAGVESAPFSLPLRA